MSDRAETVTIRVWPVWAIAGALAVAVTSMIGVDDGTPNWFERLGFTVVPFVLLAAALSVAAVGRHWVAVGALVMAASASVLTAIAAGDPVGLMAVVALVAVLALASPWVAVLDPGLRTLLAAAGSVALVAAWASTTPSRVEPAPSWQQIVSHSGATLRRTVVGVGTDGSSVALMSLLAWLIAAGVLVGLAISTGRGRLAGVLPVSIATVIVGSWAIERWRGEIEPGSPMWIMAAATLMTALALPSDTTFGRGVGRTVLVLAATSMTLGVVHQVRRASGSGVRLTGGVLAGAGFVAVVWWLSRSRRPRGVNVVAAREGVPAARTLVAALDAAGAAVGDWTADSRPETVYGATVVVGAPSGIVAVGARHPELVGAGVRVIGLLPDDVTLVSSTLLPDEVWVGTTAQRDALLATGVRRVSVVALPAEPVGGWAAPTDSVVLTETGRNIQRVISGWSSAVGSPVDTDGGEYPENNAIRG